MKVDKVDKVLFFLQAIEFLYKFYESDEKYFHPNKNYFSSIMYKMLSWNSRSTNTSFSCILQVKLI